MQGAQDTSGIHQIHGARLNVEAHPGILEEGLWLAFSSRPLNDTENAELSDKFSEKYKVLFS